MAKYDLCRVQKTHLQCCQVFFKGMVCTYIYCTQWWLVLDQSLWSSNLKPWTMCVCLCLYGVANSSSSGLCLVVETRQGQGALELVLQANKKITHAYSSCNAYTSCGMRRTKLCYSRPHYCLWPASLPRGTPGLNSMLLIGYSASHGQVGGVLRWGWGGQQPDRWLKERSLWR